LKDNYGHLIDFLIEISKLSYFNFLDLADFFDASIVSRFLSWCGNLGVRYYSRKCVLAHREQ